MARILIAEPHAELRELLAVICERLGHEAIRWHGGDAPEVGLLLFEPADAPSFTLAQRLRAADAGLPMIDVSMLPPSAETRALSPASHLLKPFSLEQLEGALERALERGAGGSTRAA